MRIRYALIGLICWSMIITGCATTYTLPLPAGPAQRPPAVMRGDHVHITMRNGGKHDVTVVQPASDHFTATERGATQVQRFDYADMVSLRMREPRSRMSTGGKVGVAVLVVAGIAATAFGVLLYGLNRSSPDGE